MPSTRNCLDSQRKLPESSSSIRDVGKSKNLRGKLQIQGLLNEKVLLILLSKSEVAIAIVPTAPLVPTPLSQSEKDNKDEKDKYEKLLSKYKVHEDKFDLLKIEHKKNSRTLQVP